MSLLGSLAANTIGLADTLTPGRLGQTLNNNIRNPALDIYGTYRANNATLAGLGPIYSSSGGTPSQPTANQDTGSGGTVLDASTTVGSDGLTPQQRQANTTATSIANASLGRLPGQIQTAQDQVRNTYGQNLNELESGRHAADQNYQTSTSQNAAQYVSAKNQINDQASTGLTSLLRILGQHGAGGSSAAQYAVPNAVGQVASQQRAGAGQNFGENEQNLDTNYNTYLSGYDNSKKQLADWLAQNTNQVASQGEQTRQSILNTLAGLQTSPAAAQPYIDQINASANQVDQLAKFNPTYTGVTPTYTAPDVSSYTVNQTGAPQLGTFGGNTGAGGTILNFLQSLGKDRQQQPAF